MKSLRSRRHRALCALLVDARKAAKVSQHELARRLKASQTQIARIESGERRVDVVEFMKLGEILGFDPAKVIANLKKTAP